MQRKPFIKTSTLILLLVLLLGGLLRLYGIRFGEPLAVHPDEHNLLYHAMEAGAQRGNPGWFEYPSGMVYLTLAIQGVHYLVSGAATPQDFWKSFIDDPFIHHLWIRCVVAIIGVIGLLGLYLLAGECAREQPEQKTFLQLGSLVLLAGHFLHVRDSHFATVDIPLTTAITLVLWLMVREMNKKSFSLLHLTGISLLCGICCSIKYTALPLLIPLVWVCWQASTVTRQGLPNGFLFRCCTTMLLLLLAPVGFLLVSPYALLDYPTFLSDLGYQFFTSRGHEPVYGGGNLFLIGYLQGPWFWGGGRLFGTISFFGLLFALTQQNRQNRILLLFAIPYLLLISFLSRVWGRWFLPVVPLQIFWTVCFVGYLIDTPWMHNLAERRVRILVGVLTILLLASPSLLSALRLGHLLCHRDSRSIAVAAIPNLFKSGDMVLATPFCPPLPRTVQKRVENSLLEDRSAYHAREPWSPEIKQLSSFMEEGLSAILYSSFYWESTSQKFLQKEYPGIQSYLEFREQLEVQGEPSYEIRANGLRNDFNAENIYAPTFRLWAWQRPGPNLVLYHLGR